MVKISFLKFNLLNGVIMGLFCLTGTIGLWAYFVPIDSGMAIILWIGIVMVSQSFTAVPSLHVPAVVIGLMPGIAGWGVLLAKNARRVAGFGTPIGLGSRCSLSKQLSIAGFIAGLCAMDKRQNAQFLGSLQEPWSPQSN